MATNFEGNLIRNLEQLGEKFGVMMLMYSATKAEDLTAKMKQNRKWTDRTGMAKATLNTKVSQPNENTIRFTLAHGVDYGIWLELANEKNFAIVLPTLQLESPKIMRDFDHIIEKIRIDI